MRDRADRGGQRHEHAGGGRDGRVGVQGLLHQAAGAEALGTIPGPLGAAARASVRVGHRPIPLSSDGDRPSSGPVRSGPAAVVRSDSTRIYRIGGATIQGRSDFLADVGGETDTRLPLGLPPRIANDQVGLDRGHPQRPRLRPRPRAGDRGPVGLIVARGGCGRARCRASRPCTGWTRAPLFPIVEPVTARRPRATPGWPDPTPDRPIRS